MEKAKKEQVVGLIDFLGRGGAELLMIRLLNNDVISKIFLLENIVEYEKNQKMSASIDVLGSNYKTKNLFLKYGLIPYYAFKLSRRINKNNVVISLIQRSDFVNLFSKIFVRHKSIVTVVVAPVQSYRGLRVFLLILMRFFYKRFADMVVVNSYGIEHYCEKKLKIPKSKLVTIHNPLDVFAVKRKSLEPLNEFEAKLFYNKPIFITVGRLAWQKGQWHLLRIFKEVKKSIPMAKLLIIGDGELREYLVKLAESLGFKTFANWRNDKLDEGYDVYFLGSRENPYKFVAHSSLFIFTSFFEGFSYSISETLVCGTPIISADCRFGPREILAPNTDLECETRIPEFTPYGILMPVLDKKQRMANESLSDGEKLWAETIMNLWHNKEILKKYVNVGVARINVFDLKSVIPQWENVLEKVQNIL